MSGHTKGPWEVARTDAGIIVRTESVKKTRAGASRYAAIGGFDRSDPEQLAEALANARLIAAAPELLEALSELVDEINQLVSESCGVAGLHQNGDVATWEEILPGGRFEWLGSLERAESAIAKVTEEPYATDERTQHSWS